MDFITCALLPVSSFTLPDEKWCALETSLAFSMLVIEADLANSPGDMTGIVLLLALFLICDSDPVVQFGKLGIGSLLAAIASPALKMLFLFEDEKKLCIKE